MKANHKVLLIILPLVTALVISGIVGFSATLEVDGDADCSDDTGEPYCTIQAAVHSAGDDDTLLVKEGNYNDERVIVKYHGEHDYQPGRKSYRIIGDTSGNLGSVPPEDRELIDARGFHIRPEANGTTIRGFHLTGNPDIAGIAIASVELDFFFLVPNEDPDGEGYVKSTDNQIHFNEINNHIIGVGLYLANDNTIGSTEYEHFDNYIHNNLLGVGLLGAEKLELPKQESGNISVDETFPMPTDGNYIGGNLIDDNYMGVGLLGAEENTIEGNLIEGGNTNLDINLGQSLFGIGIGGIQEFSLNIYADTEALGTLPSLIKVPGNNNSILDNVVKENAGFGVLLVGSEGNEVQENTVSANGIAGIATLGINEFSLDVAGLDNFDPEELPFDIISDPNPDDDITPFFSLKLPGNNNSILDNVVNDNAGMGIWLLGSGENTLRKNEIYNNGTAGIGIVGFDEISVNVRDIIEDVASMYSTDGQPSSDFVPEEITVYAPLSLPANNNEIVGNEITNNGVFGIGLLGSSGNEISYNSINDNFMGIGAAGLNNPYYLEKLITIDPTTNQSDDSFDGLINQAFEPIVALFSSFIGIEDSSVPGIAGILDLIDDYLDNEDFVCESNKNIISYNYVHGNQAAGIGLLNANNNKITYNTVTNTTEGVDLPTGKLPGFEGEEIFGTGILLSDADNSQITNNVIQDNEVGIYLVNNPISEYFDNPGAPKDNFAHYNSITGNSNYGVLNETTETFDATLNFWGNPNGPTVDWTNTSGTDYEGGGDKIVGPKDSVYFSPWISGPDVNAEKDGIQIDMAPEVDNYGVQLPPSVNITVDDVGPKPATKKGNEGYLNRAIEASNSETLSGRDTIEVRHGEYDVSPDQPVTESAEIVSCIGCPMATVSGESELSITVSDVHLGGRDSYPTKGFNIEGDVTVEGDIDASSVHINWNNISGTITNAANGTLDAEYNWWGDPDGPTADDAAGSVEGDVDYTPFLSMKVCALMEYMEENNIDDPKDAVAGMVAEDLSPCELTTAQLTGMGFSPDEAEELCEEYGCGRVMNAVEQADTSGEFVELLGGYRLPAGAAGGLTNNTVAGGAGSVAGKTVGAVFEVCELIKINFPLSDFEGNPTKHLTPTVSLVKLNEDGEKEGLEKVTTATYEDEKEAYVAVFNSCELPPGYYLVQIDLRDGSSLRQIIEIVGNEVEKEEKEES